MNNYDYFHKFTLAGDLADVAQETIMSWQEDIWDFLDACAHSEDINDSGCKYEFRVNPDIKDSDYTGEVLFRGRWYPVDSIDVHTGLTIMSEVWETCAGF